MSKWLRNQTQQLHSKNVLKHLVPVFIPNAKPANSKVASYTKNATEGKENDTTRFFSRNRFKLGFLDSI